ncbi:MAG: Cys-tRNA(Pro) deacylase [Clostridia bacterium]|nr:Cys-tRNA(Pro) deacylase [Clostridia bacterium]
MTPKALPKTNAMRMLTAAKIPFEVLTYEVDESDLSGTHIAQEVGLPMEMVFKTLVAKGDKTGYIVFCIPVDKEIDLKRAAVATGNKRVEMIHVKELLPLTGYIRGGCSPIGMKKKFPTYFHTSAAELDKITVSAGIRGAQLLMDREVLISFVDGTLVDVAI